MTTNTLFDASGFPINRFRYNTVTSDAVATRSAQELIEYARLHPPEPIIQGLLNRGDILLMHGLEESFKSVLVVQIAESIAFGRSLLRCWDVPKPRKVGVIETEIHEVALGERLGRMFPNGEAPGNLFVMGETAMRDWRKQTMDGKFKVIQRWVNELALEVLMIDTVNDFFRGNEDSSIERSAGKFFDELRNLRVDCRIVVRHDRKMNPESDGAMNSNERIRGSGEWKEDPEAILFVERQDRRTNQVNLEVGKLRYGRKPEPISAWFDAQTFRLTPLPPVIALLEERDCLRRELVKAAHERFDLGERKVDELLAANRQFLTEGSQGHEKRFTINLDAAQEASWWKFLMG